MSGPNAARPRTNSTSSSTVAVLLSSSAIIGGRRTEQSQHVPICREVGLRGSEWVRRDDYAPAVASFLVRYQGWTRKPDERVVRFRLSIERDGQPFQVAFVPVDDKVLEAAELDPPDDQLGTALILEVATDIEQAVVERAIPWLIQGRTTRSHRCPRPACAS